MAIKVSGVPSGPINGNEEIRIIVHDGRDRVTGFANENHPGDWHDKDCKEHHNPLDRIGYADRPETAGNCVGNNDNRADENGNPALDPKDRLEKLSPCYELSRGVSDKEDEDEDSADEAILVRCVMETVPEKFRDGQCITGPV